MTKAEFERLFLSALEDAARSAEDRFHIRLPRSFTIELHGAGSMGVRHTPSEVVEKLYLANGSFYKIVDVAVLAYNPLQSLVFMRVSGHAPVKFAETWDPLRLGPFKIIEVERLRNAI